MCSSTARADPLCCWHEWDLVGEGGKEERENQERGTGKDRRERGEGRKGRERRGGREGEGEKKGRGESIN